jgi:nitrate/TMAO reductase-like tetraheme cytochrome c subunit
MHSVHPSGDAQKENTRNPHGPLTIPCENCHTAAAWRPIRAVPEFDHNKTSYPLRGMHEKVKCVACHIKPVFTNVGKNCADCHADIHRRQMGSDCAQCHTVQGWNVAVQQVKDHQNRFPLLGAHAAVQCDECHKQLASGIFYGLSTQCDSCHLKDWQGTTNPPHASAGPAFASANCQGCHNFDSWLGAKFDHSTTGFPLTAGHANVPCASCHVNNNYNLQISPTDCGNAGCHLTTWQQTNNPPHPQAGPTFAAANCSQCHNTTSWTNVTFNHSATGFPLTNSHATVPCASCHINNNYNLQIAPTDCANSGCHQTDWQNTNNPVHSAAGTTFAAVNCSNCHTTANPFTTTSWTHTATGWALVGNHQMSPAGVVTNCNQCHVGNNYNLTVTDCYNSGCHTADWNSTATLGGAVPNHVAAQFPPSLCSSCHDTLSWADGKFDHSTTGWALTGGHVVPTAGGVQACTDCHVNNNYSLTAANTACYGCHVAQWNSTQTLGGSVPNHIAAGYPTTCDSCHTTSSWLGATFNHTYFPIPHHGSVCNDCHQVSTDYSSFTCINCHTTTAHQQTQTVNQHDGVSGFVYGTTTCYNCHKNGGGG